MQVVLIIAVGAAAIGASSGIISRLFIGEGVLLDWLS